MRAAGREVVTTRAALGHTVATGFVCAPFVGYLASSQQVFHVVFDRGRWFAVWFGLLALAIGAASLANARLLARFGMRRLSERAATSLAVVSIGFVAVAVAAHGSPACQQAIR